MDLAQFDYELPSGQIAQFPAGRRDGARLLVMDRASASLRHQRFSELPELLVPGDLLVLNDTRVFPARLRGVRARTNGAVEVLFLHEDRPGAWLALTACGGRLRGGEELLLAGGRLRCRLVERRGQDGDLLELPPGLNLAAFLEEHGEVPLPPYVQRERGASSDADRLRYQTVYARETGAVAAPTAGLHFTEELLQRLEAVGVGTVRVTLHVGPGTFRPVKTVDIDRHCMHAERYRLTPEAAGRINTARASGGRVVAVGTTSTRVLETLAGPDGRVTPGEGLTDIFIRPPHAFRAVDALITNFHLPCSTLLMLVCAFAGIDFTMATYAEAVRSGYRFYSYGDCSLVV